MGQALGFVAGGLTAVAFFPQVLKTWRTRSTDGLSTGMLFTQSVGVALWIVYGVWINALPIILTNVVALALMLVLLVFKRLFRSRVASAGSHEQQA